MELVQDHFAEGIRPYQLGECSLQMGVLPHRWECSLTGDVNIYQSQELSSQEAFPVYESSSPTEFGVPHPDGGTEHISSQQVGFILLACVTRGCAAYRRDVCAVD